MSTDMYEKVTKAMISALESGVPPWIRPWKDGKTSGIMPVNASTGRAYSGINVLALWAEREVRGFKTGAWVTYKQAKDMGGQVRAGEKGAQAILWKPTTAKKKSDDEKPKSYMLMRSFTVFNLDQVDGIEQEEHDPPPTRPELQAFIDGTGADVRCGGDRACYLPKDDYIQVPPFEQFQDEASYWATLTHELVHWTGHESRLKRDFSGRFGDSAYAFEELVAEIGGAFCCAHLGIEGRLQHEAYVGHWLKILKGDDKAIFTAASAAEKAHKFLTKKEAAVQAA